MTRILANTLIFLNIFLAGSLFSSAQDSFSPNISTSEIFPETLTNINNDEDTINKGEIQGETSIPTEEITIVESENVSKTNCFFQPAKDFFDKITSFTSKYHIADNLEVGANIGTTGIGIELGISVTRWARLRAGLDWMPRFNVPMDFGINTFADGLPSNNFSHVQELVFNLTGIEMDDKVRMIGKPTILNFKLLVDVYPFQNNRHWHFTAGFYVGSDRVAVAKNDLSEKPTLVGLNIYNRAYEYFTNLESIFDVPLGGGAYMDPDLVEELQEKFRRYGRMGIHIGDFKDGTPYIMEPAPDGTVSAKAIVNSFKPYLGFGYSATVDPLKKLELGVEAGVWFWGGAPNVINHDYKENRDINMTKDLVNVKGKVGDYLRFIKALPVYPAINFRISYTIF